MAQAKYRTANHDAIRKRVRFLQSRKKEEERKAASKRSQLMKNLKK